MINRNKAEPQQRKKDVGVAPVLCVRETELVFTSPDKDPDGTPIGQKSKVDV